MQPVEERRASRAAILTIDDDAAVSRAVARDLRRRYGEEFRIVRAESGAQALDALREIKLRGERVAVLLADYRMPEMSGLEFLEQAMDLFPSAARALLTAYADTDAAIQAINVIDLDHYLLKPWDPPEEKLYPVVDALIEVWRAAREHPIRETKLIGHRWSARSHEIRDFLARNMVPYHYLAADEPEGARLLEAAGLNPDVVPVIVSPDGEVLVAPSTTDLAVAVGLSTAPTTDFYDLAIVGGGPAGLGAAVYGASEGLRTVLVEKQATGGQAGQSSRIENYLGFPDGVSGGQLTDRARRQATKFGAEMLTARDVTGLELCGSSRVLRFDDGTQIAAHAVVLATGVSYRRLTAAGVDDFCGRGVYYGAAAVEAHNCRGQDVYIVGGANSAGQAAVFLSRQARSVTLLVRGSTLDSSMSHYLIEQLREIDNIRVRTGVTIVGAKGGDHLEQIEVRDESTGVAETLESSWLFAFIGAEPLTDWLDGVVARDARGFVLAGPDLLVDGKRPAGWELDRDPWHLETNIPGVFVAGDVRSESVKRVASAVGDGAMAVTLVHRYLERL